MTNEVADGQMTQENRLSAMFQVTPRAEVETGDGTEHRVRTQARKKDQNEHRRNHFNLLSRLH